MNHMTFEGISLKTEAVVYYIYTNVYSIITLVFNSFQGYDIFLYMLQYIIKNDLVLH
ncbi:hypothetical protein BAAL111456_12980 [Bacillus albus]